MTREGDGAGDRVIGTSGDRKNQPRVESCKSLFFGDEEEGEGAIEGRDPLAALGTSQKCENGNSRHVYYHTRFRYHA
jgi:hypothetical protein